MRRVRRADRRLGGLGLESLTFQACDLHRRSKRTKLVARLLDNRLLRSKLGARATRLGGAVGRTEPPWLPRGSRSGEILSPAVPSGCRHVPVARRWARWEAFREGSRPSRARPRPSPAGPRPHRVGAPAPTRERRRLSPSPLASVSATRARRLSSRTWRRWPRGSPRRSRRSRPSPRRPGSGRLPPRCRLRPLGCGCVDTRATTARGWCARCS